MMRVAFLATVALAPLAARAADCPPTPTAPAQAAEVGYTTLTYGPRLVPGTNLFPSTSADHIVANPDGTVTFSGGSNNWSGHWLSTNQAYGTNGWKGIAFGGGAYFETTLYWKGTYLGYNMPRNSGWPAFWAVNLSNAYTGKEPHIELDFFEFFGPSNPATTFLDWYGSGKPGPSRQALDSFSIDGHQAHTFGTLWVPATATTQGYASVYYDDVLVGTIHWDKYNPNRALPPSVGTTSFSPVDSDRLVLLFGSSSHNPMTVLSTRVWQGPSRNNVSNISATTDHHTDCPKPHARE
jgi:hypothetical protein